MQSAVLGPVCAVKLGWKAFTKRPIFLFASTALWLALSMEGWSVWIDWGRGLNYAAINALRFAIPITIYSLLAFPVLGGIMTSYLSAARGMRPTSADYLTAIKSCGKWWKLGGRAMGMTAVFYVLISIMYTILFHEPAVEGMTFSRLSWTVVGALTLSLVVLTKWPFGWFALAETSSLSEAHRTCTIAMRGRTLGTLISAIAIAVWPTALLALGMVVYRTNANAYGVPGWIAFWTGLVFSTAIALSSMAAIYVHLTQVQHAATSEKAA